MKIPCAYCEKPFNESDLWDFEIPGDPMIVGKVCDTDRVRVLRRETKEQLKEASNAI